MTKICALHSQLKKKLLGWCRSPGKRDNILVWGGCWKVSGGIACSLQLRQAASGLVVLFPLPLGLDGRGFPKTGGVPAVLLPFQMNMDPPQTTGL